MKKLTAFILAAALLFSLRAGVPVSADGEATATGTEPLTVYYVTQAEFEQIRDEIINEMSKSKDEDVESSAYSMGDSLLQPLLAPLTLFAPIVGPLYALDCLMSPIFGVADFFRALFDKAGFELNKDKMYKEFSVDNLCAAVLPEYAVTDGTDDTETEPVIIGYMYFIEYKEADAPVPDGCIPVAIKTA